MVAKEIKTDWKGLVPFPAKMMQTACMHPRWWSQLGLTSMVQTRKTFGRRRRRGNVTTLDRVEDAQVTDVTAGNQPALKMENARPHIPIWINFCWLNRPTKIRSAINAMYSFASFVPKTNAGSIGLRIPNRPFYNIGASKVAGWRSWTKYNSLMSWWRGSKIVKGQIVSVNNICEANCLASGPTLLQKRLHTENKWNSSRSVQFFPCSENVVPVCTTTVLFCRSKQKRPQIEHKSIP